mmetsp:Transcript_95914/g.309672  ORF Transcript_95914/g.309672 Transcript_95914/m.309672 type:complete len:208 (-) Transcript_95914:191-814(-)
MPLGSTAILGGGRGLQPPVSVCQFGRFRRVHCHRNRRSSAIRRLCCRCVCECECGCGCSWRLHWRRAHVWHSIVASAAGVARHGRGLAAAVTAVFTAAANVARGALARWALEEATALAQQHQVNLGEEVEARVCLQRHDGAGPVRGARGGCRLAGRLSASVPIDASVLSSSSRRSPSSSRARGCSIASIRSLAVWARGHWGGTRAAR